jgi:hypothetical protein
MTNLELAKEVIKATTRFKLNQIVISHEDEDSFRVYNNPDDDIFHGLDIILGLSQIAGISYYCAIDEQTECRRIFLSVF